MNENDGTSDLEAEEAVLVRLARTEAIAVKKASVYSHLLTDAALSEDMEALEKRHEQRKKEIVSLTGGKKS